MMPRFTLGATARETTHRRLVIWMTTALLILAGSTQLAAQNPVTFGDYDVNGGVGFVNLDPGYPNTQHLADVNADGRADYCRLVGDFPGVFLSCALAKVIVQGPGDASLVTFGQYDVNSDPAFDLGLPSHPQVMADVNADGRADYCRFLNTAPTYLSCALAGDDGTIGQETVDAAPTLDQGHGHLPRFLADANGDGRADYCRFVGDGPGIFLSCATATTGGTFGQYDVNSVPGFDIGYGTLPQRMADVNGDGRADYCRFVGDSPNIFLSCALATSSNTFGLYDFNSPGGYDAGYGTLPQHLVDVNDDGRADYCRFVGNAATPFLSCGLATSSGFAGFYDVNSAEGFAQGDLNMFRTMADVDASGKAGYCRFVGLHPDIVFSCGIPQ